MPPDQGSPAGCGDNRRDASCICTGFPRGPGGDSRVPVRLPRHPGRAPHDRPRPADQVRQVLPGRDRGLLPAGDRRIAEAPPRRGCHPGALGQGTGPALAPLPGEAGPAGERG